MAIACQAIDVSAGPACMDLVMDLVDSVQSSVSVVENADISMPTHAGLGLRFDLNGVGGGDDEEGYVMDLGCRLDLFQWELPTSNGDDPIHPVPAVHVEAELWKQDEHNFQTYIMGHPEEENRLRSVEVNVSWHEADWSTSVILNDAAVNGIVDWDATIPGRLELNRDTIGNGAMACLDAFLDEYSLQIEDPAVDTFFEAMRILGLMYTAETSSVIHGSSNDTVRWWIDGPALNTFVQEPGPYLVSLISDANGRLDGGKILGHSDHCLFYHLAQASPMITWVDNLDDPFDGHLHFQLPGRFKGHYIETTVSRYGELSLLLAGVDLGAVRLHASLNLPLLEPERWATDFSVQVEAESHHESLGLFSGTSVLVTLAPQISASLHLPSLPTLPWVDSSGCSWNANPPSEINLLSSSDIETKLLPMIPGLMLDQLMKLMIERLLLRRLGPNSPLSTILVECNLAGRTSDGAIIATSLFGLLVDPELHFRSAFYDGTVFHVPSVLNVAAAISRLLGLTPVVETESIADEQFTTSVTVPLDIGSGIGFVISESETSPGSIAIAFTNTSEQESLVGSFTLNVHIVLNLHPSLSIDLEGSNFGATLQSFLPPSESIADTYVQSLVNSFSASTVSTSLQWSNQQLNWNFSVDWDGDGVNPPSVVQLYPEVVGLQAFIFDLIGELLDAAGDLVPILVEEVIHSLTQQACPQPHGCTIGEIIVDILSSLELWSGDAVSGSLDMASVQACASNPSEYVMQKWLPLAGAVIEHIDHILPRSSGGNNNDAVFVVNYDNSLPRICIQLAQPSQEWAQGLSLCLGRRDETSHIGIWASIDYTYKHSEVVEFFTANACIGVALDTDNLGTFLPFGEVILYANQAIISSPIDIQPCARLVYESGQALALTVSSMVNNGQPSTVGDAFWANILPSNSWQQGQDWGTPDLSALLVGAINQALDFLSNWSGFQTLVGTSICGSGAPCLLQEVSKLGPWLRQFGILDNGNNLNDVATIESNLQNFSGPDVIPHVLNCAANVLIGAVTACSSSFPASLFRYKPNDASNDLLEFSITEESVGSESIYGININLLSSIEVSLGQMILSIETSDSTRHRIVRKGSSVEYSPGLTFELLGVNNSNNNLSPHFSIEMGYLSFCLSKADRKPLLDSFMLLNNLRLTTCMDFNLIPQEPMKLGVRLDLDDFGIALGGDGTNDGGNSLAAGVFGGDASNSSPVAPLFDIGLIKHASDPFEVDLAGELEKWFTINKQFGPVKIAQIGVRVKASGSDLDLTVLVDGEAEIAGLLAQVDDLSVTIPFLQNGKFTADKFGLWTYDMAGCAISYTGPGLKVAGALRKTTLMDQAQNEYIEYQGLCTIGTPTITLSAIGAFGRVPSTNNDDYVTCFVIAAVDYPLGGIPEFFVTGLVGGLGVNRDLIIPPTKEIASSPFVRALDGFSNPIDALDSIRAHLPAKRDSYWFAVGVKFTTYQVLETKGVLFIKISDGFTIGILGLSSMSLPSKQFNIGYVELAFCAYFDSEEQVLMAKASLTDASYLFDKNCRLTGGFALASWFNRGEFLLSLGGYHPDFKAPAYYPKVDRLGLNWKPFSKLTVKGEAYFTICSSAVMLGGALSATYKAGRLSASFDAGVNVLVVFDPFYYSFDINIDLAIRYKTRWKTFKAGLGAGLEIEGPKMRGKARVELWFVSFTVKFGPSSARAFDALPFAKFVNKHVLQLPEPEITETLSHKFSNLNFSGQVSHGMRRPEDGKERTGLRDEPWLVGSEFDLAHQHMFPADIHEVVIGGYSDILAQTHLELSDINIAPCGIDKRIGSKFRIKIMGLGNADPEAQREGISYESMSSNFPETIWSCELDSKNRPKAKLGSSEKQPLFLSGMHMKFRSISFPQGWKPSILVDQTEPCTMIHNLPFRKFNRPASSGGGKPANDKGVGIRLIDDDVFKDLRVRRNEPITIDDLVRLDERKEILSKNRNQLNQLAKTTYPPTRPSGPSTTTQQLEVLNQIAITPAVSTKTSYSNHLARTTTNSDFSAANVGNKLSSTLSKQEPAKSSITYGTTQNSGGLLR